MGVEEVAKNLQAFSYQHESGEIYTAHNLEAARGICPVLGKMSLEEAGLLLELEAMGKQQLAAEKIVKADQPVIEKSAKQRAVHEHSIKDAAEPITAAETSSFAPPIEVVAGSGRLVAELPEPVMRQDAWNEVTKSPINTVDEVNAVAVHVPIAAQEQPIDRHFAEHPITIPDNIGVAELLNSAEVKQEPAEELPPKPTYTEAVADVKAEIIVLPQYASTAPEDDTTEMAYLPEDPAVEHGSALQVALPQTDIELTQTILPYYGITPEVRHEKEDIPEPAIAGDNVPNVLSSFVEILPDIKNAHLPTPIEEISAVINKVAETLEQRERVVSAEARQIVEEIITLPLTIDTSGQTNEANIVNTEERLNELFKELFETLEIDYTPELIKSFVTITKLHYMDELLETSKNAGKEDFRPPDEIGTREFLQKLLSGLSNMKRTIVHFYEIGKSTLRLYVLGSQPLAVGG